MIDTDVLTRWFQAQKRDLPWRKDPSFYTVWVSEVMLQQTQASVVIPYFIRWMELFPSIEALAAASEEAVMKAWEGLGYYSRARHLHRGAQELVGIDVCDVTQLQTVKGIGPYTRGAIAAFAFHRKAVALDGNVMRVLSRFFLVEGEIERVQTRRMLEELAWKNLPEKEPWVIMEGLIELGALVCQKEPLCFQCPLREKCLGRKVGQERSLPRKKERRQSIPLIRHVTILLSQGRVLVRRVPQGQVMAGLYEFPYYSDGDCQSHFARLGVSGTHVETWAEEKQTFTRYRVKLFPALYSVDNLCAVAEHTWLPIEELHTVPFCSGHRKIIRRNDARLTY